MKAAYTLTALILLSCAQAMALTVNTSTIVPNNNDRVEMMPRRITPGTSARLTYRNDALRGKSVYVHFGFNGWNLNFPNSTEESVEGNRAYFRKLPLTWDDDIGAFFMELPVPREAKAIHFVFCWDDCRSGKWDNNNRNDYAWPVVFPYIGPLLSWNANTPSDTGVVITFESATSGDGWLEFIDRQGRARTFRGGNGVSHTFTVTGLSPATTYRYRVGLDRQFVSDELSFRTTESHDRIESASFIVMGDAQDNGENGRFSDVVTEVMTSHSDVDFILSPGDLPWNDRPGDWWTFFDKGRALFSRKVFMPVLGNHDTPGNSSHHDATNFMRYFRLPYLSDEIPYYSFSMFNMKFLMLSSEHQESMNRGGDQYEWLATELRDWQQFQQQTADRRTFWTFVSWHIPPFNAGSRHSGRQFDFRAAGGLFQANVDWFFGGHEHLYQRSAPVVFQPWGLQRMERYGDLAGSGAGVLIVPPMGAFPGTHLLAGEDATSRNIREALAFPALQEGETATRPLQGFVRVDIASDAIRLRTYATEEASLHPYEVVDEVSYAKPRM